MRKLQIGLLIILCCAIFLTACQATPDEPVVVQKDLEQMIEKAQATPEEVQTSGISLREQTGAPQKLELENTEGNFTLSVDAAVTVPDAYKMPIIRVKQGEFTQTQVTDYWDALVGDTVMWKRETGWTKSEIESKLVGLRKSIAQFENEPGYESIIEQTKADIKELEAQYAVAPDEIKMEVADSTLYEYETDVDGTIYIDASAVGCAKDNSMFFSAQNMTRTQAGDIIDPASIGFSKSDVNYNYGQVNTLLVDENTELDESIKQFIKTTPAQAKAIVEDFLTQTQIPMSVYSMSLVNDEETGIYDGVVAPAEHYAYRISCIRTIEGTLPCAMIRGGTYIEKDVLVSNNQFSTGEGVTQGETYIMEWNYEEMGFMVNDSGIISFEWRAPLEILETKVEDCTLLPFSDIQDTLEKMIPIKFETTAKGMDKLTCRITDVRLEMMRIVEQGSIENGLLIPVWNFYGVRERTYKGETDETGQYILLCINAVDGSVIEISKGY